ncbi:hypothetical protein [Flavobacterium davisii]|nr:hypothetical protein [Flavobacterium davisii]QYS89403.1 hypothetical protein JJC05_03605 [Flavobacterium davisii]
MVKLHSNGIGSNYLYQLEKDQIIRGTIIQNSKFNLPKNEKIIMIANGTGVAPFLGMIAESTPNQSFYLYAGFRNNNSFVQNLQHQIKSFRKEGKLQEFKLALSREENRTYVTDLINHDLAFVFQLLKEGGILMICGSLAMQKDIEKLLENHAFIYEAENVEFYKSTRQILTDCY